MIDDGMWDLVMTAERGAHNLGLLVPRKGTMELKKRIPIKSMGRNKPEFSLYERNGKMKEMIHIQSDLPFPYLHKLHEAYLVLVDGSPCLSFRKIQ